MARKKRELREYVQNPGKKARNEEIIKLYLTYTLTNVEIAALYELTDKQIGRIINNRR